MIANSSVPKMPERAQPLAPKQLKLLGATVEGVGIVTSISTTLFDCFCLIEDPTGQEHHRFLKHLSKDEVTFLPCLPPYIEHKRRVGIGLWDEMYSLESASVVRSCLQVAA